MPAKHEYAGVGRASAPALNGAGKKEMEDINVGVAAKTKADAATVTAGLAVAESAATPRTPTSSSVLHARSHSHAEQPVTPISALTPNSSPPEPINTTSAKHTSFSSSRPAPVSPPASIAPAIPPSKHHSQLSQSRQPPANSRRASTLSTASNTSTSNNTTKYHQRQLIPFLQTVFSPLYLRIRLRFNIHIWQEIRRKPHHPTPHVSNRGTIHIRDFAYPTPGSQHTMSGPDTPKLFRKILKKIRASLPSVLVPKIASSRVDFVGG
ncbi:hypothetical protein M422DRAFT_255307 [Sphaerobolus stellatus SS14]|uniref:Uncharacterized protein n=1 Tax=Sphaerobolus stellatus (strain SS14) TaxID=990650 RepID=A0A0C9VJB2_SPHS4|nr:hypothetical protein M422DRAFT_255307 [Sphaerobolus stellatus SS14]